VRKGRNELAVRNKSTLTFRDDEGRREVGTKFREKERWIEVEDKV
jgi:hypothetical protein